MDTDHYLVVFILAVFIVFGIGNFFVARLVVRRFYQDMGFSDEQKSDLENPADSVLLSSLSTSNLYRGEYQSYKVSHCKAYPTARRKLTFSRVKRKHNQMRWSLTLLQCRQPVPPFCLLPVTDTATMFLMLNDAGVDLSEDEAFSRRYHLRTEHADQVKRLLFADSSNAIREFLMHRESISVECIDNTIILKRLWPVEKIKQRLSDEFDFAIAIAESPENSANNVTELE